MTAIASQPAASISAARLTPEQIVRYHRNGFLTLDRIAAPADVRRIREILDGLFGRLEELPKEYVLELGDVKGSGQQVIPQILNAHVLEPALCETEAFRNAEAIAKQLIGPDAALNWDHSIYKPPHNKKETPWHQDLAYAKRKDPIGFAANFWIPLQDVTVESGCMRFVPNSHLGDLLPHHPGGNDPRMHVLETDGIDDTFAVPCPLPAGGCTIHLPKTLHYTGPNNTDQTRRAWILVFGVPIAATWKRHRL